MDRRTIFLVALLTGYILAGFAFGRHILSLLAPQMVGDGLLDYRAYGVVAALNQGGYLVFSLISGRLTGRVDPRHLLIGSMAALAASLLLMAVVRDVWSIAVLALIMGLCTAGGWIPQIPLVRQQVPARVSGRVLAVIASGTAFGTILTGLTVPLIVAGLGWPSVWTVFGAVSLVLVLLGLVIIPSARLQPSETSSSAPATPPRRATIAQIYVMMFLSGGGLITFQAYLAPYLAQDLGYGTEVAGAAWAAIGLGGMFSGLVVGSYADRASVRKALILGHLAMALALATVALVADAGVILAGTGVFGLVYFGTLGLFPSYLTKICDGRKVGATYGLGNLMLGLGGAAGNFAGGLMGDLWQAFQPVLLICVAACAGAALTGLLLVDDRKAARPDHRACIR